VGLARIPGVRQLPPRLSRVADDVAMFESWHGKFSDNPRALSEELRRRDPDMTQVWVLADPSQGPPWATCVQPETGRYLRALGRPRWLVASNEMPGYFRKKRKCTYVQTWHGTPLKRIAFDMPKPTFDAGDRYLRNLRKDVAQWDYLVSPNRFSTDLFRRAFQYDGDILETGYPRNDVLSSPSSADLRGATRAELGIGEAQVAVLYAPTWRDSTTFALELDLDAMTGQLGERYVLLLRSHQLVAKDASIAQHPQIREVSHLDDIRNLYLAADVLITDYSSVMFDFAVTRKPMLFFTYDIERYRDELRGFYFDFSAEAPGPLLRTTGEIIEALTRLDAVVTDYTTAYARFVGRFCHLDDGRASSRVLDAIFTADR
jgi:CDP-glycerol glycerophosphotransferase